MKLSASRREDGVKARSMLREGLVPAIVYGHHEKSQAVALDSREFQGVYRRVGRTQLVDLVVDGGKAKKVLVKAIQTHPRHLGPIHVDLHAVSMREKLQLEVPIRLTGESPAAKSGDGEVVALIHQVRVECLPGDIPEHLDLDISGLVHVGDGIKAGELALPDGVGLAVDAEELLVKVQPVRDLAAEIEAEEAAEAEQAAEGSEEPAAEASDEADSESDGNGGSGGDSSDKE